MRDASNPQSVTESAEQHAELLRFLTWKLGCRDLAADFAQEVYLRVSRFRASAQEVQHPRSFLFSVANNLVIDHMRRKKLEARIFSREPPPLDQPSAEPGADRSVEAKERLGMVQSAVNELSPKCRQALFMNRLEGQTHAEIARRLGVSESQEVVVNEIEY
ncbi:MAG: sigma-70 family RNA polymerase sigma factor [Nitrospirales bacterium]